MRGEKNKEEITVSKHFTTMNDQNKTKNIIRFETIVVNVQNSSSSNTVRNFVIRYQKD